MPKNQKIVWEEMYALNVPATCRYMTGNAFKRDSTVMPHVLAIVEASVYHSACPSVCHILQL